MTKSLTCVICLPPLVFILYLRKIKQIEGKNLWSSAEFEHSLSAVVLYKYQQVGSLAAITMDF